MLTKYDISYKKDQKVHSVVLSSVHLREFTVSSPGKRLVISVSQRQGVNGSTNSQQNV